MTAASTWTEDAENDAWWQLVPREVQIDFYGRVEEAVPRKTELIEDRHHSNEQLLTSVGRSPTSKFHSSKSMAKGTTNLLIVQTPVKSAPLTARTRIPHEKSPFAHTPRTFQLPKPLSISNGANGNTNDRNVHTANNAYAGEPLRANHTVEETPSTKRLSHPEPLLDSLIADGIPDSRTPATKLPFVPSFRTPVSPLPASLAFRSSSFPMQADTPAVDTLFPLDTAAVNALFPLDTPAVNALFPLDTPDVNTLVPSDTPAVNARLPLNTSAQHTILPLNTPAQHAILPLNNPALNERFPVYTPGNVLFRIPMDTNPSFSIEMDTPVNILSRRPMDISASVDTPVSRKGSSSNQSSTSKTISNTTSLESEWSTGFETPFAGRKLGSGQTDDTRSNVSGGI